MQKLVRLKTIMGANYIADVIAVTLAELEADVLNEHAAGKDVNIKRRKEAYGPPADAWKDRHASSQI